MPAVARVRVAIFFSGLAGGGAQRRSLLLSRRLAQRGMSVDVVVVRGEGPFRADVPEQCRLFVLDPPASRLPFVRDRRGLWVAAAVPALARYLDSERPDAVLSTSTPANLTALAARARSRSTPAVVVTVNLNLSGTTSRAGELLGPLLRRSIAHQYSHADAVVAVSRGVAEDLRASGAIAEERLVQIDNPVDLERVTARAAEPLPHAWLAADAPPLVLAVGKLKVQKDFPTLLRAFAAVHARRSAHLVILGEGDQRPRLEALVRELGLEDDVAMPGFAANPFAWMARASVFVLSSLFEGMSNVLLEALASGCPVVSTDCPSSPREILRDGDVGPLVPVGDDRALAGAIERVLDGPPSRDSLRARAADFGVDRAVEAYRRTLEQACSARIEAARIGAGKVGA